jgi:RNA 3'-terminal phosphate cyclase
MALTAANEMAKHVREQCAAAGLEIPVTINYADAGPGATLTITIKRDAGGGYLTTSLATGGHNGRAVGPSYRYATLAEAETGASEQRDIAQKQHGLPCRIVRADLAEAN